MAEQFNTKRIARNTLMLYFRQILIMLVSLYTVRVVLSVLGAEDYGIYNVVAGVVTMFSFLTGAMASASQRYLSYYLGKSDAEGLRRSFIATFLIYILISIIVVLLAESVGLWFVHKKLVITIEKVSAAKKIYQFAIISFVFTLLTTPYMSAIIAHENMNAYAYISIVESILKLCIVFLLKLLPYDKLVLYGFLLLLVTIINTSLYRLYSLRMYKECKFSLRKIKTEGKPFFYEILSFTGWTLFGQFTNIIRNQAVTILFNQFFSSILVASRTICLQVTNAVNVFSQNFNTSLFPPIVKEYSQGNMKAVFSLLYNGCKLTFFLIWILGLPFILHMDAVLFLWLKDVPDWTILFTRLAIIEVIINSVSTPLATVVRASGKIFFYETCLGSLQICIFLVTWILFKFGYAAWVSFLVAIIVNFIMLVIRLFIARRIIKLSLGIFIIKTVFPVFWVTFITMAFGLFLSYIFPKTVLCALLQMMMVMVFTVITIYFLGIDKFQRKKIQLTFRTKFLVKK